MTMALATMVVVGGGGGGSDGVVYRVLVLQDGRCGVGCSLVGG